MHTWIFLLLIIVFLIFWQAQRNNEDVNSIQPLFSVNIDHRVSSFEISILKYKSFIGFGFIKFKFKMKKYRNKIWDMYY